MRSVGQSEVLFSVLVIVIYAFKICPDAPNMRPMAEISTVWNIR